MSASIPAAPAVAGANAGAIDTAAAPAAAAPAAPAASAAAAAEPSASDASASDTVSQPTPPGAGISGDQHKPNSLYVGDLNETVNENTLYEYFNAVATLGLCMCRNNNTRRPGYAYANFHSVEDSESWEELNCS